MAVTAEGAYITPLPCLYRFKEHLYLLNSATGELIRMNEQGEVQEVHQIWHKDRERFAVAGYEPFKRGGELMTLQYQKANPGLVPDGEYLWTVTRYHDARRDVTRSRITRFKMGEKAFSQFVIPGVEGSLVVLKKEGQSLIFFHMGNTHELYRVDIGSLKTFTPVRG